MLTDETATPEQIEKHLARLRRLLQRAVVAEDWATEQWVRAAVARCEALLSQLQECQER